MYQIKLSAVFQKFCCLDDDVLQRAVNFMPCDHFCIIRIDQTVMLDHIRRITCDYMKRSRSKQCPGLLDIAFYNRDSLFQMIIPNASHRHIRTLMLYLKTGKMSGFCLCRHQDRDNSSPGTNIQNVISRLCLCESGKQNRIHSKTEFFRILDDMVPASLQIIQSLIRIQFNCHLVLIFLPFSPLLRVSSALFLPVSLPRRFSLFFCEV